jgi:HupE / UreJ protein
MRAAWRFALALLMLASIALLAGRADAHGARTVTLTIEIVSETEARLSGDPRLRLEAPECSLDPDGAALRVLRCPRGLSGQQIAVVGLGEAIDLVLVRIVTGQGAAEASMLTARAPILHLPDEAIATGGAVARFVRLGVEHVFSGVDHLLFLLALFWQAHRAAAGRLRQTATELLRTATAFTIAHSLTLGLTVLGWLHVQSSVSEALIAASLVLVALDVPGDDARDLPARRARIALALLFGLVHGLGFAGALTGTRLPSGALAIALVSFNVGVELAQALAFALCMLFVVLARSRERNLRLASAYLVGSAGVALFLTRLSVLLRG